MVMVNNLILSQQNYNHAYNVKIIGQKPRIEHVHIFHVI